MNLLDLKSSNIKDIQEELEFKVSKSPAFFENAALVIGLDQISASNFTAAELCTLVESCKKLRLIPVATRGASDDLLNTIAELGMANLKSKTKALEGDVEQEQVDDQRAHETTKADSEQGTAVQRIQATTTKIIDSPVRSGQQIYAADGDLVILSAVSPGAEVLADGNIHIYGPLRGRALAGVQGDIKARIFCGSQEAELVSIAGQYLVDDSLKSNHWKARTQIYLKENSLVVEPIN